MDHGSQPKSRMALASVAFARKLLCLIKAGSMLNITSQWQDPEILILFYKSISRKIRSHDETTCAQVSFDLSVHIRDISEKQVPANLKPMVNLLPTLPKLRVNPNPLRNDLRQHLRNLCKITHMPPILATSGAGTGGVRFEG